MNKADWAHGRVMPPEDVALRFGVHLQPCPFCNCQVVGLYLSAIAHITCWSCGADGPPIETLRGAQAQYACILAWNRRAMTGAAA